MTQTNITSVSHTVLPEDRWRKHGHKGGVLWFTGLSGSGKSTLAMALEAALFARGFEVFVLDGDNLRYGLNADLGFSDADRHENIRRAGEVAALFAKSGVLVLTAFISPFKADRTRVRDIVGDGFHEIHLDPGLAACEARDPKGLYKKARAGEIAAFTGISSPYEAPENPELAIDTDSQTIKQSLAQLVAYAERAFDISDAE
ncbi:MAG: adenylyl-sulfate kinase [Rhodospirillales bacterium]|nr:adenylyl-sulfate kinase [Rhodospirillales bacterium]